MDIVYILIAFMTPILHGLACILDAHFSNNVFRRTSSLIFYASITNAIIVPFLLFLGTPAIPSFHVFLVLGTIAAIDMLYLFPYYTALKRVDTSISVALFSLGKIAIPILAWFIVNERLHFIQYVGFGLILLPSILLNLNLKKLKINSALYLMMFVSLILSLGTVLEKYSLENESFLTVYFWIVIMTTVMAIAMLVIPAFRRDIKSEFVQYKKSVKLFIGQEILSQLGTLAVLIALGHLPVLVQDAIESTQAIFTLILGFVLYKIFGDQFRENLTRQEVFKKMISFIFIIVGCILTVAG